MKNIAAALLKAQKRIGNAHKDSTNPHFKSKYASLDSVIDAVKEIANEEGVYIYQSMGKDERGEFVSTLLLHAESGETLPESKTYLVLDKNNMQGLGSAITYARRYGASAAFFITQDDDDGNGASQKSPQPGQNQPQTNFKEPLKPSGASPMKPVAPAAQPQTGGSYDEFIRQQGSVIAPVKDIPDAEWIVPFSKSYSGKKLGVLTSEEIADVIAWIMSEGKTGNPYDEFQKRGNQLIRARKEIKYP